MFLCTYTTNQKDKADQIIQQGLTMISTNDSAAFFQIHQHSIEEALKLQDKLKLLGFHITLTKTKKMRVQP